MTELRAKSTTIPETLEFAIVRFSLPSLENPEEVVELDVDVQSPDENIHQVIVAAADILIERLKSLLVGAESVKLSHSDREVDRS